MVMFIILSRITNATQLSLSHNYTYHRFCTLYSHHASQLDSLLCLCKRRGARARHSFVSAVNFSFALH